MKAIAHAPEKLYLIQDNGLVCYCRNNENDIEYVRTDSVIEWIKNKADKYIVDTSMCSYFDYKRAIEDFKDYIKEKGEQL